MEEEKLELAVLVDKCDLKTDHYSDTSTFYKLHFVTINEKGEVRNPSATFGSERYAGFANLIFRCYISWHDGQAFRADAWEILYDSMYSTGLREAELMVKTLKRIGRISDKLVVRPLTFGQYVAMIAAGLGIKRFVRMRGASRGWHNENDYYFSEVNDMAWAIDQGIREAWQVKSGVEEVA